VPVLADDVLVAGLAEDHLDLVVGLHALVVRVNEDRAEAASKGLLLRSVELLVAEEDHAVLVERLADLRDHPVIEFLGDIDAADLGAAPPGDGLNFDAAVAHGCAPVVAVRV
jgi:hypothetical protein